MRNQEGKIELHRTICVRGITFRLQALLSMAFCCFLCLLLTIFQVTCLRNGHYKDIHIAIGDILCDDIMRKQSKIGKSATI